jgi:hypothetical protein
MKSIYTIAVFGVLIFALLFAGCTSTSPPVQIPTPVPTTTVAVIAPTQTAVPFPNALALNKNATYGSGNRQGTVNVYRYDVKPTYSWTDPSWNSAAEQLAASQPNDIERGYNLEKPQAGNTFLFVYLSVQNTGYDTIQAPAAKQFVVLSDGKAYNYTSVHGSEVIIDKVGDSQYLYMRGQRDPIEYIQPGDSTKVEGYLIYEIPASFSPSTTYVAANLDYKNSAVWKLG